MVTYPGLYYTGEANTPSVATDDDVQDTGSRAGTLIEMGKAKGMNVSGKIPLSAAANEKMLANMQALLDERQSPMNTFLSGLQRASAWGSGGVNGPSAALTAMDRQRQLEQADTLAIQQNMEAMKAQQENRQNFQARMGYGKLPGTQAQAGTQAQLGMQIPNAFEIIKKMPSAYRPGAIAAIEQGNEDEWNKIIAAVEKNRTPTSRDLEEVRSMQPGDKFTNMFAGQAFKDTYTPKSLIIDGKEYKYSLDVPGMPGGATAPTTGDGVNRFNVGNVRPPGKSTGFQQPKSFEEGLKIMDDNLIDYGRKGINTLEGVINRWAPPKDEKGNVINDTNAYIKSAASRLGITPNQIIDLSNPVQRQAIEMALFLQEKGPSGIFGGTSMPQANAALAVNKGIGAPGTSVEDVALQQKTSELSAQAFYNKEGVYDVAIKRGLAADKREDLANQALNNIKGSNYGPGTELAQSFTKYAQMAGVKLNEKELDKYISNLSIQNARKFLSAESARAAMGAQFTKEESDAWLKNFAGIEDPIKYLKNFYQLEKAGALVDKDLLMKMLENKGREQEAYIEWRKSGARERIMRENVDAFKDVKLGEIKSAEQKPAEQKPTGAKANAAPIDFRDFNRKKDNK